MNDIPTDYPKHKNQTRLLYAKLSAGCTRHLDSRDNHRLFFLLKGKVSLKTGGNVEYVLYKKEFTLLPRGCIIYCSALEESDYVVINCTRLMLNSNRAYWEELRKCVNPEAVTNGPLPIRDWFEKSLEDFAFYPVSEDMYPSIYDIIFIVMRILYSKEEMLSLFLPVLQDE